MVLQVSFLEATKEGETYNGDKTEKQPCQQNIVVIATFPLFSSTTNPKGQIARLVVSLLLPNPRAIPAFSENTSVAEVKLLLPSLWMELANRAAEYLVQGSGCRRYEIGF